MKLHRIKSAIFKRFIGLMMLMGMAAGVYAQSAAEIGAMHNNCNHPNYQGDRSRCGGGNRAPAAEVWEDRYGSLALDPDTGNLYPVENETSKRRAIGVARKNCGRKDCILTFNVRNACIAASWGGGVYYSRGGLNKQSAEASATAACQENSSVCRLKYSGCSLPVRVK